MSSIDDSSLFYSEAINLVDLGKLEDAKNLIKTNIQFLLNSDDIALAYLNCGFINDKLGENDSAIYCFSKAIYYEAELEVANQRSKDISFSGRSNSRYKNLDYHGAIEDKRQAKQIRLLENNKLSDLNEIRLDYNNILLGTFIGAELEPKLKILIKTSKLKESKYDLISDYKKVISKKSKEEVIRKLESLSEAKYMSGDYKGSIKAIRRAEKFY